MIGVRLSDWIARIPEAEVILEIVADFINFILTLVDHFIKGFL